MNWVWFEADTQTPADTLVLLALADEADDDGAKCFPSLRRISDKARCSTSTVRAALNRLEDAGLVTVLRPSQTGRGHHNRYRIHVPWADSGDVDNAGEPTVDNSKAAAPAPFPKGAETRALGHTFRADKGAERCAPGAHIPIDPDTYKDPRTSSGAAPKGAAAGAVNNRPLADAGQRILNADAHLEAVRALRSARRGRPL